MKSINSLVRFFSRQVPAKRNRLYTEPHKVLVSGLENTALKEYKFCRIIFFVSN